MCFWDTMPTESALCIILLGTRCWSRLCGLPLPRSLGFFRRSRRTGNIARKRGLCRYEQRFALRYILLKQLEADVLQTRQYACIFLHFGLHFARNISRMVWMIMIQMYTQGPQASGPEDRRNLYVVLTLKSKRTRP